MRVAYSNRNRTQEKYRFFNTICLLNSEQQRLRKPSFEDAHSYDHCSVLIVINQFKL